MKTTNYLRVLDVAVDLLRARIRLRTLIIRYELVMRIIRFAMWIDRLMPVQDCDCCADQIRLAEFVSPRLFTIQAARARAADDTRVVTYALSMVTMNPFRLCIPLAVSVAPFRMLGRLALRFGHGIAVVGEFTFDIVRTGGTILAALPTRLRNLPRLGRPSMPSLRWHRLGRRGSAPQLSSGLTTIAALFLPRADRSLFAAEWHAELFVHSRLDRAALVIGIWRKLPVQAWRLHRSSRRQPV